MSFVAQLISALPTNATRAEKREVDCDPLSMYTFDWFIDEDNVCSAPPASTCLFYTEYLSTTARAFAKADGADLTTIWEIWDESLYNDNVKDDENKLRCIMSDDDSRKTYFSNMSRAMAYLCDVFATVLTKDVNNIPPDGIWNTVEYPQLKLEDNKGRVDKILAIQVDGKKEKTLWTRVESKKRDVFGIGAQGHSLHKKRGTCGAPAGAEATFNNDGDLPVPW